MMATSFFFVTATSPFIISIFGPFSHSVRPRGREPKGSLSLFTTFSPSTQADSTSSPSHPPHSANSATAAPFSLRPRAIRLSRSLHLHLLPSPGKNLSLISPQPKANSTLLPHGQTATSSLSSTQPPPLLPTSHSVRPRGREPLGSLTLSSFPGHSRIFFLPPLLPLASTQQQLYSYTQAELLLHSMTGQQQGTSIERKITTNRSSQALQMLVNLFQ